MEKMSPEIEAIITTIVYLDCRIDAILELLNEKNISLDPDDIHSALHKIHAVQGETKRHQIFDRMKDPNFDLS
jgi:hypothetical protein